MKVVCVDARWRFGPTPLKLGEVYTVVGEVLGAGMMPDGFWEGVGYILCETKNPNYTDGRFASIRFLPLDKRVDEVTTREGALA